MLPRRCLTATAGTSLVRGSYPGRSAFNLADGRTKLPSQKRVFDLSVIDHDSSLLPKAGPFQTLGAGRPLSPAWDQRLAEATPNPAWMHPRAAHGRAHRPAPPTCPRAGPQSRASRPAQNTPLTHRPPPTPSGLLDSHVLDVLRAFAPNYSQIHSRRVITSK